jgi:hypothetical protein
MSILTCSDAARCWHRNVISAIAECVPMGALAVPLIGVTCMFSGDGASSSMFSVFKTKATTLDRCRHAASAPEGQQGTRG